MEWNVEGTRVKKVQSAKLLFHEGTTTPHPIIVADMRPYGAGYPQFSPLALANATVCSQCALTECSSQAINQRVILAMR